MLLLLLLLSAEIAEDKVHREQGRVLAGGHSGDALRDKYRVEMELFSGFQDLPSQTCSPP